MVVSAHPRSRGENPIHTRARLGVAGSSPLTRGKPAVLSGPSGLSRLIPAHAGKTLRVGRRRAARGAHPRSRGENTGVSSASVAVGGSSPLTRGKLGDLEDIHARVRLIPAHAGKTSSTRSVRGFRRAHPRSRGENRRHARQDTHDLGSSPLTRGKRDEFHDLAWPDRLIPAHAGKTDSVCPAPHLSWAHPRSRGENCSPQADRRRCPGSSPLTRGKLGMRGPPRPPLGLIPAHAGKTRAGSRSLS